jgi:hypothetical protein
MVKYRKSNSRKNRNKKAVRTNRVKAGKTNTSTANETYPEPSSPFGGFLAWIKLYQEQCGH